MNTYNEVIHELLIPIEDMDIPFVALELEDLPSMDEVLQASPVTLSPPLTINQTLFTERICIRINRAVLAILKQKAAEHGVPYQTFINLLLAQNAAT